jgi:hypothetical protein
MSNENAHKNAQTSPDPQEPKEGKQSANKRPD